jgi:serine protease Do
MIRKSFAFILLASSACVVATAQTPEPKAKGEPKVFSWSFNGDGGYLGVQTEEVTKENFSKFGLRDVRGVAVEKVLEGSPAQTAGLQNGDVIVKINGEDISSTRKLTRLVSEISPDHQAKVTVLRGGSEREINVTLGKRPAPTFGEGAFQFPPMGKMEMPDMPAMPDLEKLPRVQTAPHAPGAPGEPMFWAFGNRRQIGVGLTPLTKQLSDHFGVDAGALINNVRENSPAAKAGLKAGDIIIEVDGKAVKGDGDLVRAIGGKKDGDVTLTIVRDRNRQTVRVTPEEMRDGFNTFFEFPDAPDAPGSPAAPGVFKMLPATPAAPMPLNQLFIPGRVV